MTEKNLRNKMMLVSYFFIFLITVSCFDLCKADQYRVGLKANQSAIGADFKYTTDTNLGIFTAGANVLMKVDDDRGDEYTIIRGNIIATRDPLLPGLRYGLGFEAIGGPVKNERRDLDEELFAIGFLFHMGYNHEKGFLKIPADLNLDITAAPDPLTANNMQLYLGARAGVEFGILNNACITIDYRCMYAEFYENNSDWHMFDGIILVGYAIMF